MFYQNLNKYILKKISLTLENELENIADNLNLDFPPEVELGHFAVECFSLAKKLRKPPSEISKQIADNIIADNIIKNVVVVGPYVNITIWPAVLFESVCAEIMTQGDSYGDSFIEQGKRVMVEFLSPNTNKPLHLGHLRNGALGMAVSRLLEATGYQVVKANLINDRGVHICKSMLAWQKWGKGMTPESKSIKGDHFVGNWYVKYAKEEAKNKALEEDVQRMLQNWEAGDPETVKLWRVMNKWVYDGFDETYSAFGLDFDIYYFESQTYKLGKNVVKKGLNKKVFYKDDRGNIVYSLPIKQFGKENSGESKKITVLRSDGTSLYITQDIATSILKIEDHHLNFSIYVVGSEQEYHFKCLFQIISDLGYPLAKDCYHLSYGMVYLPEGKMKSREGKVVDADDLISEMIKLAAIEIVRRDPDGCLSQTEINRRAKIIGIGAAKFYLLRVKPSQTINFDPNESISFDGFTAPYCQYAYARIYGILEKSDYGIIDVKKSKFSLLGNSEELLLLKKLIQFPEEVQAAIHEFNPSRIATHIFNTAKAFNQFYNKHPVLKAENELLIKARLALIQATSITLKKGLNLLGIDVLENM